MKLYQEEHEESGESAKAFPETANRSLNTDFGAAKEKYGSIRRTEIKKAGAGSVAKEDDEAARLEKANFEMLIDSLRKLVAILRERKDKKLNLLLSEEGTGKIMQSVNSIERLFGEEKRIDLVSLNNEMFEIISALDKIGSARQRGGLREDPANLGRMRSILGQVEEGCHMALIRSAKDGSGESKMIMLSIGKLFSVAQAKKLYVSKLFESFDKFRRR